MTKMNFKRVVKWFVPYGVLQLRHKILSKRYRGLPQTVQLEASTLCQLKCKGCPIDRHKKDFYNLGGGYLKFTEFKKFINKHPFIKHIELANKGEIFMNPDLLDIIKHAYEKGVALSAGIGTNFNTVSDELIEALVKYKLRFITIALDSASQETYSLYRENGNFDTVISNIKQVNKYKSAYKSEFPVLQWQFILSKASQHEVIKAKEMAKELNMMMHFKPTWGEDEGNYVSRAGLKEGFENPELLKKQTGMECLTRKEYYAVYKRDWCQQYFVCQKLWRAPQINWDGRLLGCQEIIDQDFGVNVFKIGLKRALNSKNFVYAKKMLQGKLPPSVDSSHIPCVNCIHYKNRVLNNDFITEFDT
jgi:MoaA/NifB/PqqE/SkfB family radical SAM enzyme